jgi:hypothetical protein
MTITRRLLHNVYNHNVSHQNETVAIKVANMPCSTGGANVPKVSFLETKGSIMCILTTFLSNLNEVVVMLRSRAMPYRGELASDIWQ